MSEPQKLTSRRRELDRRFSGWSRRVFGPYDPLVGVVCWAWLLGLLYAGPSLGWAVAFAVYTFLWTLRLAPER